MSGARISEERAAIVNFLRAHAGQIEVLSDTGEIGAGYLYDAADIIESLHPDTCPTRLPTEYLTPEMRKLAAAEIRAYLQLGWERAGGVPEYNEGLRWALRTAAIMMESADMKKARGL